MAAGNIIGLLSGLAPAVGSAFGPIGTMAGAGIGALGSLAQYLVNRRQQQQSSVGNMQGFPGGQMTSAPSGEKYFQFSRLTPEQLSLQNQLLGSIGPLLGNLQQPFNFAPIAEQARTQFAQSTIPSIAERFTRGGEGGQSTEAFKRSLASAGAGLEQGLAAQQAQMGMQQRGLDLSLLSALLGGGMQSPYESFMEPRTPSFGQSFGGAIAQSAGTILPQLLKSLVKSKFAA